MRARLPMKEDRPRGPQIVGKKPVRGVDTWWSKRDNAWTREEAEPTGVPGCLSFHYCSSIHKDGPPNLNDVLVSQPKPWRLVIWEPLQTKAPRPPKAQPYCCYINTVIFYHSPYIVSPWRRHWKSAEGWKRSETGSFIQWDQIETRLSIEHDIVRIYLQNWRLTGGTVLWKNDRWWMRYGARRHEEAA